MIRRFQHIGYIADVEYDDEWSVWLGEIRNIEELFGGNTLKEARKSFIEAITSYHKFLKERGIMSEEMWMERAQSAEAKLVTQKENLGAAIDRVREFKKNFGIREKPGGVIDIDYDKFVQNLGLDAALELRNVIDETFKKPGIKRVK